MSAPIRSRSASLGPMCPPSLSISRPAAWRPGKSTWPSTRAFPFPEGLAGRGRPPDDRSVRPVLGPAGALLPFGEHKGWGLSVACELLGAALIGGKTQSGPKQGNAIVNSMLSILVSPDRLGTRANSTTRRTRSSRGFESEADRASQILMPGDPERETKRWREANGIPIDARAWQAIEAAANPWACQDLPDLSSSSAVSDFTALPAIEFARPSRTGRPLGRATDQRPLLLVSFQALPSTAHALDSG